MTELSHLHSLATLAMPNISESVFQHKATDLVFRQLKRLYIGIDCINQTISSLCRYSAPELIEFWLETSQTTGKHLIELFNSELLKNVSVLRLQTPKLSKKGIDSLLAAPFAENLRILGLRASKIRGFKKLANTKFTQAGALPELLSLSIDSLYPEPAYADCRDWLGAFECSNIRHLKLKECYLNDECLDAIIQNPIFRQLESLEITEGYGECHVTPKGAENFLRSLKSPNLKYLGFHRTQIGDRIKVLEDRSILSGVKFATFSDTSASPEAIQSITITRPNFVISR